MGPKPDSKPQNLKSSILQCYVLSLYSCKLLTYESLENRTSYSYDALLFFYQYFLDLLAMSFLKNNGNRVLAE